MLDNLHAHVSCLARLYSYVLRSNTELAHSFVRFDEEKKKESKARERGEKQSDTYVRFCGLRFDQRLHCRQAWCEDNRSKRNEEKKSKLIRD